MRKKSKKLATLERHRYSVFTEDLTKCYFCGKPKEDLHELLPGRNRLNSMRYGYVLPVCRSCHEELTNNNDLSNKWKAHCQVHFEDKYGEDQWLSVFKKSYKD